MNAERLELALRKQRLQLVCGQLRDDFADHAAAFEPLLVAGDKLRTGVQWLRRHPEVGVAAGVVLLVVRPRALGRWLRRGIVGWAAVRRTGQWLDERLAQP